MNQKEWNFKTATTDAIHDLIKHYLESGQMTFEVRTSDGKEKFYVESDMFEMKLNYDNDCFHIIAQSKDLK